MAYTNFVVSGLTAYIEQSKDVLIKNVVFGRGTRERISIQTGVKYKEHLHIFDVDPVFGDGSDCGFTPAGTATLSERLIEAPAIKVQMEICPKNLIGKYAEYLVRMNATENELPFEQYLMDGIIDGINRKTETMIWLGDKTATTDPVKKWIDGFITIAGSATGVVPVSIASGSTAYEGVLAVYNALTENALERGARSTSPRPSSAPSCRTWLRRTSSTTTRATRTWNTSCSLAPTSRSSRPSASPAA